MTHLFLTATIHSCCFFVVFFKLEVEPTSVLEWEITYKISLQGK